MGSRNSPLRPAILSALIPLMFAALLSGCGETGATPRPNAREGLLDLRKWDFSRDGAVELAGDWEFHWMRFIRPAEFAVPSKNGPVKYLKVPGNWLGVTTHGKNAGPNGFATYRLRVLMPAGSDDLAFYVPDMRTAYVLFVNGRELHRNGVPGTDRSSSVPCYQPAIKTFSSPGGELDMVLHISNYHHENAGPWNPIVLGRRHELTETHDLLLIFQIFLFGSLLTMGLYHIGLYMLRREDRSPLYLALFCLLICVRPLITGERFLLKLIHDFSWLWRLKLEFLSLYLGFPLFATFVRSLFPGDFKRPVLLALQGICLALSLFVLVTPSWIFTHSIEYFEYAAMAFSVYIVAVAVLAGVRKREGSMVFLAGIVIIAAAFLNEVLNDLNIIKTGNFFPLGLLGFILTQAFLLSLRFSKSFRAVETLSGELESKNRQLLSLDRLKDVFLANTSHELRTPLNGIIGIADSLRDGAAGMLTAEAKSDLSLIISSGRRLASLVNDILDFSRIKNRDLTLNQKPTDLKSAVDVVLDLTKRLRDGRDLETRNDVPPDLPPVLADEDRLQQILLNLLGNAIKFTESGTISLSASDRHDGCVEVTVADTGIGIPGDKIERVFEPFEQADGSIARSYGGTGIGLSITRSLVELHGGAIRAESGEGTGSRFIFTLPVAEGSAAFFKKDEEREQYPYYAAFVESDEIDTFTPFYGQLDAAGERKEQPRVLIVDDDPVNVRVLENILTLNNYAVEKSLSGTEALEMIGQGRIPDLVLMDIMMPRISGYEVTRRIRGTHSGFDLPIMMLTAKSRTEDLFAGFEAGANDYLRKPFDKDELLARAGTLVSLKKAVKENREIYSIKQQLEMAREIQASLIPAVLPEVRGMKIAARYIPMEQVGGDFYDFYRISESLLCVFIADVTGHGIPAAMIASMVKVIFFILRESSSDLHALICGMRNILIATVENQFVSTGFVHIDTAAKKLSVVRAGHEPVLVARKKERIIEALAPVGSIIGLTLSDTIELLEVPVDSGDRIVLYTDGIIDVMGPNGEFFGEDRLHSMILHYLERPSENFIEDLMAELKRWILGGDLNAEGFQDDITIIVLDIE